MKRRLTDRLDRLESLVPRHPEFDFRSWTTDQLRTVRDVWLQGVAEGWAPETIQEAFRAAMVQVGVLEIAGSDDHGYQSDTTDSGASDDDDHEHGPHG